MSNLLLLMRHAKSSWEDPSLPDRERPLSKRGGGAAERMGAHLRAARLIPDVVLCSTSLRTRETLDRLGLPGGEVRFEAALYGAGADELLARLRDLTAETGSAAIIGHNPGMHDLAIELAGSDLGEPAARMREKFPTGALAVFEVDGPWRNLARGRARLTIFLVPRELE